MRVQDGPIADASECADAAECPICYVSLSERDADAGAAAAAEVAPCAAGAEARALPLTTSCGHQFCASCLVATASRSPKCPLCRRSVHACEERDAAACKLCAAKASAAARARGCACFRVALTRAAATRHARARAGAPVARGRVRDAARSFELLGGGP